MKIAGNQTPACPTAHPLGNSIKDRCYQNMPRKSQTHKLQGKRPPNALIGKDAPTRSAIHKPWQIAFICVVLVVVTFISFRNVRNNDFLVLDDNEYVVLNQHVQQGVNLQSVAWAFTTLQQGNWHPLTWISHMLDWSMYGNHPEGHHITNVCLHAANAVLLFLLLLYMTNYVWRSAIVAFLFALHPAHVESVAWIAERKDVLCAFFWFATLLAYAWYARKPSHKRFAAVICGCACALMSKPMAVTLPFTLLLLDYWPLHRFSPVKGISAHWYKSIWKLCVEKWPLFIMAAVLSVITFIAQKSSGAVIKLQTLPLWERICNAAISYCRYLRIAFWPDPLMIFYFHEKNHIMVSAAVLSAVALILITAACWHFRKQRPYCLVGWLWFIGTLVPVIGIVQVGEQAMAERYTYLAFIGLFIIIVWLVADAVVKYPKMRLPAQLLAVAVIAACAVKSDMQVTVWKDSVTLFKHVLEVDPRGEFPNFNLGVAYLRQGNYTEAQQYFDRALVYGPNEPLILTYSAFCIIITHQHRNLQLAGQRLEQAYHYAPDNPDVLTYMALWSALMGKPQDEEMYSRKLLAAQADNMTARLYLGDALRAQGKLDESAGEYRQVIAGQPDNYKAYNGLGNVFYAEGLKQKALDEFRLSLAVQPEQTVPHAKIGNILLEAHQLPEAVEELRQALRFSPANANVHDDLGMALLEQGDFANASEEFRVALKIDPTYTEARKNLGLAQARMKSR